MTRAVKQQRQLQNLSLTAWGLALATITCCSHARLCTLPMQPTGAPEHLLSVPALRLASFGNAAWMADLYYLRAVGNFGDRSEHAAHYPRLAGLLQHSIELDPKFVGPYLLAGTSLLVRGNDNAAGMALLRRGCIERPDIWQLPFYRGFYAYYIYQDFNEAAASLAQAATRPHAPSYIGPLATRMAAHSQKPEAGLEFIDALLAVTDDAEVRAAMESRRPLLLLEHRLRRLQALVQHYRAVQGRVPTTLDALRAFVDTEPPSRLPAGPEPWPTVFQDPLGGTFVLTAEGTLTTTHTSERLQIFQQSSPP